MQNDQSGCRKYFDLTDFAQLTFRSQKMAYKEKKKNPHASLDFSKITNEKQVSNLEWPYEMIFCN